MSALPGEVLTFKAEQKGDSRSCGSAGQVKGILQELCLEWQHLTVSYPERSGVFQIVDRCSRVCWCKFDLRSSLKPWETCSLNILGKFPCVCPLSKKQAEDRQGYSHQPCAQGQGR